MQKIAMLPLIIFEVIVNVYLTLLFIIPLRGLHSYKTHANPALNRMAFRSFIGSCATLTTSVVNLTILMVLKGEPGWICLMCCNADILFCVLVLHWATSKEQREDDSAFRSSNVATGGGGGVKSSNGGAAAGAHRATIGSYVSRSRRLSSSDGIEKSPSTVVNVTRPDSALDNKLVKHATITTECKGKTSSTTGRGTHHFGVGGWDASEARRGIREDEVELNNIRVQTIQTREVEVDTDRERERKMSAGASTDDEWVGSRKGVVGERMV